MLGQENSIPLLTLTVLSGPDTGMTLSFRKQKISLGRDQSNDFVLSDGFVSNRHGEIIFDGTDIGYSDLKSRHGSLVVVNNVSTHLQHPNSEGTISLEAISELQLGTSVIRITSPQPEDSFDSMDEEFDNFPRTGSNGRGEHFITVSQKSLTKITDHLSSKDNKSLEVIFDLAKELNGINTLEEVIERINAAAFSAFSSANFFSITLGETPDEIETCTPFLTVDRAGKDDAVPILSRSILRQAAETGESILWLKDSMGMEVSQSIVEAKIDSCLCSPLFGQAGLLGVMQVDTRGRGALFGRKDLDLFNVLASSAAFAVERAKLSNNIVRMFEGFVEASVTAIEARDPTTAGHSHRVADYTIALAEATNISSDPIYADFLLSPAELTELRYAALLHDFGKIAVNENVLNKATRLEALNMALIAERFEVIKIQEYNIALHQFAKDIHAKRSPANSLEHIRITHARFSSYLDEKLDWLEKIDKSGYLSDEDSVALEEFSTLTYMDTKNHIRPYLLSNEVENFSVKTGNLNAKEWENMRSHAAQSEEYLQRIPWSPALANIPCIAGGHHEKLDGSGYPLGIQGEEVIAQVRMLTIADIFDALTAVDRPYRKAATLERASKILTDEAEENKLDKVLVATFVNKVVPKVMHLVPSLNK